jgi:predicted transcriptional regulator
VDAPQQAQIRVHALASPPPTDLPVKLILGATAAGLLLVALGAGLYSRFHSRSEVLKSSTRDRLVELIRQNPGISMTDAAQAMGLARNAVHHHVRMLARVQVVRVAGEGGRKTLYLVGAKPSDAPPAWLLRNAACAAIVRALQASPSGLPREAVHGLLPDVPERTRNYNIQKLLSVGVVVQVETPEGGKVLRAASSATGA